VRVLQCIDTLGGGGAERQLVYLADGLMRLGHEVDVVCHLDGPWAERLCASGATLHRLGWLPAWKLVRALGELIERRRIALVHSWLGRMTAAAGVAAPLSRRPWVYGERSLPALDRGWRALVRRTLVRGAAAVVANSEAGAASWRAIARGPVHVVGNGVEVDEIAATPPADRVGLGIPAEGELIVYAGRFVPPKNISGLAATLARVLIARPRAFALCVGEGEELPAFRAAMARAGLGGRCLTPGFRRDVWPILRSADVVVAPSRHEGRPNVVLEAMAAGRPLVLSDIAPHRECVPREAALWFSPESPPGAAAAIGAVLDDQSAAAARVERARTAIAACSIDRMARAYAHLYEALVADKTPGTSPWRT
jgi:glycosyltransferase involved in cell wall biosynthesis